MSSISGLTNSNVDFLSNKNLEPEELSFCLAQNRFAPENLVWDIRQDSGPVLRLEESQWELVQELELNVFYDDGEGFIDLGMDNVFEFN